MADIFSDAEVLNLTNHFVDGPESKFCHDFAEFTSHEADEVHHMVCGTGEAFAQFWVLSGHAHRAGVQMAFAHHDTTLNHQRSGCDAPFFSTQEGSYGDVSSGFHLTVCLHGYAASQSVPHQGLVGFCEAEFPWQTGMADGTHR